MKRIISIIVLIAILTSAVSVFAADKKISDVSDNYSFTAEFILNTVTEPQVGSVGGEWAIIGLSRSGYAVDESYYENYYSAVEKYVKEHGGILHKKKYTEYSRVVLALTAIGADVKDVGGYNLLLPISDYEKTVWQGTNGAVWALIALDSKNYEIPENKEAKTLATRQMYIDKILAVQNSDGGFSLSQDRAESDIDVTAMALVALAKYREDESVKTAVDNALTFLSETQNENGGFSTLGAESSESTVQVICALSTLGISPDDERFVKNGNTLTDNLMSFKTQNGGFRHIQDGDTNLMATEQALYALAAIKRFKNNQKSLYDMSDTPMREYGKKDTLEGIHKDVKIQEIKYAQKTFADISEHENRQAIEALAMRGIINGMGENAFAPDMTMTRAQFATIVVSALGLEPKSGSAFSDVNENDWFYPYVSTAYEYAIVSGMGDGSFDPHGTITKQQAAVMLARAAELCAMNTRIRDYEIQNILAGFTDYRRCADWSKEALAFCYKNDILNYYDIEILPDTNVKRCEIAQMLYNMMVKSGLIVE